MYSAEFWRSVTEADFYSRLWRQLSANVDWQKCSESYERAELRFIERLPKGLKCYYLIMRLDGIWGNGGLQSVFLSHDVESSSKLAAMGVQSLEFLGATATAAVIRRAIDVIANSEVADCPSPRYTVEEVQQMLDSLDVQYDNSSGDVNVYKLLEDYAHRQPEEFILPRSSNGQ